MTSTDWTADEHGSFHRSTAYAGTAITPATVANLARGLEVRRWAGNDRRATRSGALTLVRRPERTGRRARVEQFGQRRQVDLGHYGQPGIQFVNGVQTNLVGACNKNGVFYAWRSAASRPARSGRTRSASTARRRRAPASHSAAFDLAGNALYAGANDVTSPGQLVRGVVRRLDPATGGAAWTTQLACGIVGSPTCCGR